MSTGHTIRWCQPMRDFVLYEAANGKTLTLLKYNPLNHDLLIPLNHDIPSLYGVVDVDWMLRIAPACGSGNIVGGTVTYFGAKTFWNTVRGIGGLVTGDSSMRFGYGSVFDTANRNAPRVATAWVSWPLTLAQIFRPASEHVQRNCSCRTPLTAAVS
ncbi:MAG: hypothetical protein HYY17_04805 [Planctomycetes bacterium]|nr:hypothetical protein [Planctomycetota bacterium]